MGKKAKKIRKILKWTLIPLSVIIILLIAIIASAPLIAESYLNSESGNKTLNGIVGDYLKLEINYEKIDINIWKTMPNVNLELHNTKVFSKALTDDLSDTLVKFDTLRLSVNAMEFLKNDSIIINNLLLSNPTINGYINPNGKANWEVYESDTAPEEDTSSFDYKIKISELSIDNICVNYTDDSSHTKASLDSSSIKLYGDMTADILKITTELKLKAQYNDSQSQILAEIPNSSIIVNGEMSSGKYELTTNFGQISAKFSDSLSITNMIIDSFDLQALGIFFDTSYNLNTTLKLELNEYGNTAMSFKNIPLNLDLKAKSNADFNKFDIDTVSLTSTDIFVNASGNAEYLSDSSWNTDLTVNLNVPNIDNLINMIPASLVSDFKKYKLSGGIAFDGTAKGKYKNDKYPNIDAKLSLNNIEAFVVEQDATVKLNLETNLRYDSENNSNSFINVSSLNASVGENYLELSGKAKNILGDPYVDAKLNCNLNLDYISKLFPIEDIEYKGKLSSNFEARFALSNLMRVNFPQIYMLGNINIDRILLRIPSQRFFVFGKNTTVDVGVNSIKSRRTQKIHLSSARIAMDTLKVRMATNVNASVSRLSLTANVDEPQNTVPQMRVSGRLRGMEAILNDTMFVSGKSGRISLSVRPDTTDNLIPALRATLNLDSVIYFEPAQGAFLDSTRITLNGRPRVRKFRRENGKRVEIDQSTRKPISIDSLITLCTGVKDAETALRKFTFDGKVYAKAARYMSPYFNLRTAARRFDITFTDDTIHLNNFFMRVGKSGLRINGKVENVRRAFLRGRTLSADLSIRSRNLDLNEILYANYLGSKAKAEADLARNVVQKKFENLKQNRQNINNRLNNIPAINDSAQARFTDSLRRAYRNKSLSDIYTERMSEMKAFMDKAYNEELSLTNDDENAPTDTAEEIDYDTVPMSLIEIPANLNCKLSLKMDTIKFAGLKMNDFKGDVTAQNSTLSIVDLQTSSNVGDLKLNATYNCNSDEKAKAGIDVIGTNITVENLLNAFPMVDSILPMLSSFEGKLDCELSAITDLDAQMEPMLPTLKTACYINGKDLVLLDGETFTTVAKYLLFKKKTENVIDNMSVEFTIDSSLLNIYPFTLSMDKYKVAVSGEMDFDFKYSFHISLLEPKGLPIPHGIYVKTKEPKEKKNKKSKNEEDGELVEETDDFEFRLGKALYKDEKSVAQTINLGNKSGFGRVPLQQTLRKTIQEIIDSYKEAEVNSK